MKIVLMSVLFITSYSLYVVAQAAESNCSAGRYQVSGVHSLLGHYQGDLVINSQKQVQRKINLTSPNDGAIEQLWEGVCLASGIQFNIRPSNTMTEFNGFTLTKPEFAVQKVGVLVTGGRFVLPGDGQYEEVYLNTEQVGENLFSPQQRLKMDATGDTKGLLINIGLIVGINQVIKEYRKLSILDPYRQRSEFINKQQFKIQDFTDLEFYRNNSNVLRLRNLSANPLSIAEAKMRRLAFAPSLAEKAKYKESISSELNLNDKGILEVVTVDENGKKIGYQFQNDSALWTAMYAWSQYTHYKLNGDRSAYENFKRSIQGLVNLMKITNDPKIFARFIVKSPASENLGQELLQGTGEFADYKYRPRSNNDMTKGLLIGYLLAYDGLETEDQELRAQVSANVARLTQVKAVRDSDGNLGSAHGLKALWHGEKKSFEKFIDSATNFKTIIGHELHTSSGFYLGGIEDASGIHLTTISSAIQYMIAARLESDSRYLENKNRITKARKEAKSVMLEMTERMEKAHHDYLNIMIYAITRNSELKSKAIASTKVLFEVPIKKLYEPMVADLSLQPGWSRSAWPKKPWKYVKGLFKIDKKAIQENAENIAQGAYSYPIFESNGLDSNYLWKDNSFVTKYLSSKGSVNLSADYLVVYWLAVQSGLITAEQ